MTVDLSTLEEGDAVHLKVCVDHVDDDSALLNFGDVTSGLYRTRVSKEWLSARVTEIEKKPFDWSTVKPGMAFVDHDGQIVWIVGRLFDTEDGYVVSLTRDLTRSDDLRFGWKDNLLRLRKHDIEVRS